MTKFEEELFNKVPCKFELTTEAEYKKTTLINHFKNWHSDDEYQELFEQNAELTRENNIVNQINSKLESQIIGLKSQLQQQALPVVPECVGDYISGMKENGENIAFAIMCSTYNVAGEGNGKAIHWKDSNPEDFARAWLDGYTIEKPELFYLKHIDMSKSDAHLNWYLAKGTDNVLIHQGIKKGKLPKLKCILKLTQQEIDSMHAESYEQIPVSVEDGE